MINFNKFLVLVLVFFAAIAVISTTKGPKKIKNPVLELAKTTRETSSFLCPGCNLVLITMTNLRYDHMSVNGYGRLTTPNLDRLARDSLIFNNAFAHSSWTLPEGISIYTGLYPYQHGIMNRYDGSRLSPFIPTLVETLKKNGYKTAAFTGGFDYNPNFGLTTRFDEYQECTKGEAVDVRFPGPQGPTGYGELDCTIPKATDWLQKNSSKKFFLHIQGFDAHCPFSQKGGKTYDPNYKGSIDFSDCLWTFEKTEPIIKDGKTYYPVLSPTTEGKSSILLGEEDIKHLIATYDESIVKADAVIGSFIEGLKEADLFDKTIIIFTSEHGDMFGKYGRFMRGGPIRGTFYDDVLRVPLFIRHPYLSPKRFDDLVEHVDIMPTVLDFLGFPTGLPISGKSLGPLIKGGREVNDYVFAGSEYTPTTDNFFFSKRSLSEVIRGKKWKLIKETLFSNDDNRASESAELYNIENDKEELNNLASSPGPETKKILENLEAKLDSWSREKRKGYSPLMRQELDLKTKDLPGQR